MPLAFRLCHTLFVPAISYRLSAHQAPSHNASRLTLHVLSPHSLLLTARPSRLLCHLRMRAYRSRGWLTPQEMENDPVFFSQPSLTSMWMRGLSWSIVLSQPAPQTPIPR